MGNDSFLNKCIDIIVDYVNAHLDVTDKKTLYKDDVYVVWCCKTLQNNKALLSTTLPDGIYYEFTYNGDTDELYMDVYKKWENRTIKNFSGQTHD